ncbi:ATP-binding protein [Candidatus Bathycorpusculum sp.]|uniref:ATP-binding protein n=1 Tax=Candidatus Bathycorpusculum sp. TaxID=2994959 RepID=UPI0028256305|nr:ATP-binding protein [Candidatus Termitimicrobium sp.]MCL2432032.1 ATP-binding protein [Candidatus Termitimicrobium sp.]
MLNRNDYLQKIRPFIGKDVIKIITGLRRSGKSVILEQLLREINSPNTMYLNFEDLDIEHLLNYKALHDYVCEKIGDSKEQFYLFFDEIQDVEGWEKAINSLRVKFKADIYITGSNSKMLSSELSTHITGRYVEFVVYPFSFAEFKQINAEHTFEEYLQYGGMPFLHNINFEPYESKKYLKDVFNSILLKDVVKRNKIRDIDLLERIVNYVLDNVGKQFSATSISNFFKQEKRIVAPETILNYLKACEEAFLFKKISYQDMIGKKALNVNGKYYIVDHGLREAVSGTNIKNQEIILENIVYLELTRRGYDIKVGRSGAKEIDFVCEKDNEKFYVQVCYILNKEKTIQREFVSLLNIKDNYPKIVLYKESSFKGNYEGIPAVDIEKWLLENNKLPHYTIFKCNPPKNVTGIN